MRLRRALATALLAASCTGCPVDPGANDPSLIVIEGADGNLLRTKVNAEMTGSAGSTQVILKKGALSIDGKAYGRVTAGSKVKIDTEGKVFVNGVRRMPDGAE